MRHQEKALGALVLVAVALAVQSATGVASPLAPLSDIPVAPPAAIPGYRRSPQLRHVHETPSCLAGLVGSVQRHSPESTVRVYMDLQKTSPGAAQALLAWNQVELFDVEEAMRTEGQHGPRASAPVGHMLLMWPYLALHALRDYPQVVAAVSPEGLALSRAGLQPVATSVRSFGYWMARLGLAPSSNCLTAVGVFSRGNGAAVLKEHFVPYVKRYYPRIGRGKDEEIIDELESISSGGLFCTHPSNSPFWSPPDAVPMKPMLTLPALQAAYPGAAMGHLPASPAALLPPTLCLGTVLTAGAADPAIRGGAPWLC
eukprot:gene9280-1668_t